MSKKILIIEDEEILLDILKRKLGNMGYEIFCATDGVSGMEAIKEILPDLILLDIIMPKMGGLELMEKVQLDDSIKNIPIVIISNSGQPVELDKARRLGAKDWLIKTDFNPQEVVEKVIQQIGMPNN